MSESDRVQRWRQGMRDKGKGPITLWLSPEEKLRLQDLAQTWRCTTSEMLSQALAAFHPGSPNVTAIVTDTEQIRTLIQEALAQTPNVSALVTDTVTATMARDLPAMVRAIVEGLALEIMGMSVTDTSNGYETDIKDSEETNEEFYDDVADANSNVTETSTPAAAPTRPAAKRTAPPASVSTQNGTAAQAPAPRRGGRTSTMRQPILDLLSAHPEGLNALEIKVYLNLERNIGDVLQGMVRNQLLTKQGTGAQVRYRVLGAPPAPPAARPAAREPARRASRKAQRV